MAAAMPWHLDDFDVDLETKQVLRVALQETRMSLGLADNLAEGIIARRVVELAEGASEIPISYAKAH
jgi:hypothetical protein